MVPYHSPGMTYSYVANVLCMVFVIYYMCISFYTLSLVTEYRILVGNILIQIWEVLHLIFSLEIGYPEWFLVVSPGRC